MSPLPGDNEIRCKIQREHKLENQNKFDNMFEIVCLT